MITRIVVEVLDGPLVAFWRRWFALPRRIVVRVGGEGDAKLRYFVREGVENPIAIPIPESEQRAIETEAISLDRRQLFAFRN